MRQEKAAVREAAFHVLADIANEASAPGHEADRAAMTARLMTLLQPDQPAQIKIRGLRLLPIVIPPDGDVGPVAALLCDKDLRERAREALEETGTAASRTALRQHLAQADPDPDFACALLNSLGRLHDRESLELDCQAGGGQEPEGPSRRGPRTGLDGRPGASQECSIGRRPLQTRPRGRTRWTRCSVCSSAWRASRRTGTPPWRVIAIYWQSAQGQVKDGALAGLGRVGDASCVPVILEAIRDDDPPTLLVGMNALRALPGKDVTRGLIDAYPTLPKPAQLALIPVLGARRDPLVLPLLEQLAQSEPGRNTSRRA